MQTQRVTNLELQKWIARHRGLVVETARIEACRQQLGIGAPAVATPPHQLSSCPPEERLAIMQAFRSFGMLG